MCHPLAGMKDFSKDGRICIDATLQVFDVKSGKLHTRINAQHNNSGGGGGGHQSDFTMVRLTYDGQYAIWAHDLCIKVARVNDNQLVGQICTHEKPVCLELLDFGYTVIIGREDGHILTAKIIDGEANLPPNFRPETTKQRLNAILDKVIYPDGIVSTFEQYYQVRAKPCPDTALPKLSKEVQSALVEKAKVPHAVIKTVYKTSSFGDLNSLEKDFKKRRGSSPALYSMTQTPPDVNISNLNMSESGHRSVPCRSKKHRMRSPCSVSDFFTYRTSGRQKSSSISDIFSTTQKAPSPAPPASPQHSSTIRMTLSDLSGGVGKMFKRMTSDGPSASVVSSPMIARKGDHVLVSAATPPASPGGKLRGSPKLKNTAKTSCKTKPPKNPAHNHSASPRKTLPGMCSLDDGGGSPLAEVGRNRFFSERNGRERLPRERVETETCNTKL